MYKSTAASTSITTTSHPPTTNSSNAAATSKNSQRLHRIWYLHPREHGRGPLLCKWSSTSNPLQPLYLAVSGSSPRSTVTIYTVDHQHVLTVPASVLHHSHIAQLDWSADGNVLAILCGHPSYTVVLVNVSLGQYEQLNDTDDGSSIAEHPDARKPTAEQRHSNGHNDSAALTAVPCTVNLSAYIREPVIVQWSKFGLLLAIGGSTGELAVVAKMPWAASSAASNGGHHAYASDTSSSMLGATQLVWCIQRHRKRIVAMDWNTSSKLCTAGEDRQICITSIADGKTFGQVKVKSRPTHVKFGSRGTGGKLSGIPSTSSNTTAITAAAASITQALKASATDSTNASSYPTDNIVSVSMDRKTILLYNLDDAENALELAFQSRYGSIVSFHWFNSGNIMVAFTLGYVVVISTHLEEIGREQFCARFHRDGLREIAYNPYHHQIATAADHHVKRIDMNTWKEVETMEIERSVGVVDKVEYAQKGNVITVTTRNGYLLVYAHDAAAIRTSTTPLPSSTLLSAISQPISGLGLVIYTLLGFLCCCILIASLADKYAVFRAFNAGEPITTSQVVQLIYSCFMKTDLMYIAR